MFKTISQWSRQTFRVIAFALCASALFAASAHAQSSTPAGTTISNRARIIYTEPAGGTATAVTPVVTVTVMVVNGVAVTPDETAPSGTVNQQEIVTARYSVCNTGNNPTAFTINEATVSAPAVIDTLYLDADSSGTVTPGDSALVLNQTRTPLLAPRACTNVLLLYRVNNAPAQSQLVSTILAHSASDATGNPVEDRGTIIRTVKEGPVLRDPDNPALPPRKSVNGAVEVTAGAGSLVDFEIAFRNTGDEAALNVAVTDELPVGLIYEPNTLRMTVGSQTTTLTDHKDGDGGDVTGQTVSVRLPQLDIQEVVSIKFSARVAPLPAGTVLINRAQVAADNAQPVNTRDVRVILAPQGMVFDGSVGSSSPVKGAVLRLATNPATRQLLAMTRTPGFAPNEANSNPFSTSGDGLYSFRITNPAQPENYYLMVDADGYKSRSIQVTVTPVGADLYNLRLQALDDQPLAVGGGYTLTTDPVVINNLAACVSNIPLFATGGLQITKTADRAAASIGDVVSYRIDLRNTARAAAYGIEVRDTLPQSFYYVPGSGLIQLASAATTQSIEPVVVGDTITFHIATVPGGGTASIIYRVRIGANARTGMQYNLAIATNGGQPTTPARAGVKVSGGIFSTDQFIVGRVFVDKNGNGRFDAGDQPVAGARLVTQNGTVALTDKAGNFNIPVIGDGAVVISLDRSTVPQGMLPVDRLRVDGSAWSRLLQTPLGGGSMLHADFALGGGGGKPTSATNAPSHGGEGRAADGSVGALGNPGQTDPSRQSASLPPAKKRGSWFGRLFKSIFSNGSAKQQATASPQPKTDPVAAQSAPAQQQMALPATSLPGAREQTESTAAPPTLQPALKISATDKASVSERTPTVVPAQYPIIQMTTPAVSFSSGPETKNESSGVEKVEPGDIQLDVEPDAVALQTGFDVPVRVAAGWSVHLYLNDRLVEARIGEERRDQGSATVQLTFIGLDLAPGPNHLRAVAVAPDGRERAMREVIVYGRGVAVRLTLAAEVSEIPAGRRAQTVVVVKGFDAWGNPAQDGEIALTTNLGMLSRGDAFLAPESPAQNLPPGTGNPLLWPATRQSVARAQAPTASPIVQQLALKLKDGSALVNLVSSEEPGTARVSVRNGVTEAQLDVRFAVEQTPRMMVGYGQLTVGRAAPIMSLRGVDDHTVHSSLSFFFRGNIYKDQVLTLAYDSERPLERYDGEDRLFQLDPRQYTYSVFGDASTHYSAAQSNTKVYARWDLGHNYGRSFLLFGDYLPEKRDSELAAYGRRLTGVEFHFENSQGDYVSFGGAHPDTLFGRDVFPGGQFGFARLSETLILPGSESVWLEVRDRRNPDLVLHREQFVRGVDYNLDPDTGQIFFSRVISAFDVALNLEQIVVTYEYRATGQGTLVYTARASKLFRKQRTRIGFTANLQQQGTLGNFALGGIDVTQQTFAGGEMHFEWAASSGRTAVAGNFDALGSDADRYGNAFLFNYDQPLRWRNAKLQMSFRHTGAGFSNPFGGTVIAGVSRAGVLLDVDAFNRARLRVGLTDERNRTDRVNNSRQTVSLQWTEQFSDRLTVTLGYDYRHLSETSPDTGERTVTDSQLVTAGIDWRPTDRLSLSVRREQNLTASDPTYPNQTVLSASYKLNDTSRLFITQALRSAPITPINDLVGGGFAYSQARREMTAGIETRLFRDTSLMGGYRIENGVEGSDSYAVMGLGRKWKPSETLALDANYERAFHLAGAASGGYNTLSTGVTWQPRADFIMNSSYQWRDRDGSVQTLAAGFTGKPTDNITALGQFQFSRGSNSTESVGQTSVDAFNRPATAVDPSVTVSTGLRAGMYASLGFALRPKDSDRMAAFFNYQHRSFTQEDGAGTSLVTNRERSDTLSLDTFWQAAPRLALFGKVALSSVNSSRADLPSSPTLTYLLQGRAEYRLRPRWDLSLEARFLKQPVTGTSRMGLATELGYWVTPDVRFGVGYNTTRAIEQPGRDDLLAGSRRGFYFSITTKFERVFDFFGAKKKAAAEDNH